MLVDMHLSIERVSLSEAAASSVALSAQIVFDVTAGRQLHASCLRLPAAEGPNAAADTVPV